MALKKTDIAEKINKKIGLPKQSALKFTDLFFETIKLATQREEIVKLAHFGTFKVKNKKERIGRNPQTKETAVISERKIVTFNASDILKNKVNKKPS